MIERLGSLAKRGLVGFAYGCGFAAGIMLTAWALTSIVSDDVMVGGEEGETILTWEGNSAGEESDVRVVDSRSVVQGNVIAIVGTVRNTGSAAATSTELRVDLFDAEGVFLYQCKAYTRERIPPDSELNFIVECHFITQQIFEAFDHYTIRVLR